MTKKYYLVKITWLDASDPGNDQSWYRDAEVDAFSNERCLIYSVGWLKSKNQSYTTLCSDYNNNHDGSKTWGRPTKIPNGMIIKTERLKEST
jgi:hypothetical protein